MKIENFLHSQSDRLSIKPFIFKFIPCRQIFGTSLNNIKKYPAKFLIESSRQICKYEFVKRQGSINFKVLQSELKYFQTVEYLICIQFSTISINSELNINLL
jgi:hypothetical protein